MKKEFANIVDHLARNNEVMFQLNNHAYSSELIPEAVHITVQNTNSSPYERASKLVSSLLSTLEAHPNPNVVFSSFITSFKKVGLTAVANRLTGNLSKTTIFTLMHCSLHHLVETPQLHSDTHHQVAIKDSHQSKAYTLLSYNLFLLCRFNKVSEWK